MSIDRADRPRRVTTAQDRRVLGEVQRALRGERTSPGLVDLDHACCKWWLERIDAVPFLKPADDPEVQRQLREMEEP